MLSVRDAFSHVQPYCRPILTNRDGVGLIRQPRASKYYLISTGENPGGLFRRPSASENRARSFPAGQSFGPKSVAIGSFPTWDFRNVRNHRGSFVMLAAEAEPYHFDFQCLINKLRPAGMPNLQEG
jgi:hypothetical protein